MWKGKFAIMIDTKCNPSSTMNPHLCDNLIVEGSSLDIAALQLNGNDNYSFMQNSVFVQLSFHLEQYGKISKTV